MPFTAVCLGSIGAGKTRLLTQLTQSVNENTEETEPLPTFGINHFDVKEEEQNEKGSSKSHPHTWQYIIIEQLRLQQNMV